MTEQWQMFIDGDWVNSSNGEVLTVMNPDNNQVFATVPRGTIEDARRAVEAADRAKSDWRAVMPQDRAQILFEASRRVLERSDEIARTLVMESGSTIRKAKYEVQKTADYIRSRGEEIFRIRGETLPSLAPNKFSMTIRQPRGVVLAIAPWNFPLILAMEKVATALACGNTVVLKPASDTPCTLLLMAGLFSDCHLPKGVFNVVTGSGASLGDELVTHPKISYINFTGSSAVGRHIAELAGRHLKKVTLELGGKNPVIVLKGADLDTAASAVCYGAFYHSGQICMAVGRAIVEQEIVAEFTERVVSKARKLVLKKGALFEPETILCPLINQTQLHTVQAHVQDALEKGAKLLAGGKADGLYHEATVLNRITPEMLVYREETFGPVLPIIEVATVDEAVAVANDSRYGLSAGVFTNDLSTAFKVAEQIEAGMVHVNESSFFADQECASVGGVKDSGIGRVGSHFSIEEATEVKWITIQQKTRDYPI